MLSGHSGLVLPRIPKGARGVAAQELVNRLDAVIRSPNEVAVWHLLFGFSASFIQPARVGSGRGRNLTSAILKQVRSYASSGSSGNQQPANAAPSDRPSSFSEEEQRAKRASFKLQEGDVRGAARVLSSQESLAPRNKATEDILRTIHPAQPADRRVTPQLLGSPIIATVSHIKDAVRGFTPGSAGGKDGLKPQHLKDLLFHPGSDLATSLTNFVNLVLSGGVPDPVRPCFFGASLIPFAKKGGGVRPIAVGLTLRRMASKVAVSVVAPACAPALSPLQLGVGVRGGAEASVHAARRFVNSKSRGCAFVELDFKNAFNSLRRDSMLEAVAAVCPSLLPYAASAYAAPSHLWLGESVLSSEEGVQQGDPLGPLLFSLTLHPILERLGPALILGYLDDIGLGARVEDLPTLIRSAEAEAGAIGLQLNPLKCQIIGLDPEDVPVWEAAGLPFLRPPQEASAFLGAPLYESGVDASLSEACASLRALAPRLALLTAHEAFHLLRVCFGLPKLQYLLRTSPAFASSGCKEIGEVLRDILTEVLNLQFDDLAWTQACLPVRWGGLGVRDIAMLAPSAFLSSSAATAPLVDSILPSEIAALPDPVAQAALRVWEGNGSLIRPLGAEACRQRAWDEIVCSAAFNHLFSLADVSSQARLLAVSAPNAGDWLHTLPVRNLGLTLTDRELRICSGLRLGTPLVRRHTCVCRSEVDVLAHHGLSCRYSKGRQARHSQANDIIARALRAADVQTELEPRNLLNDDKKKADGATLFAWSRGRQLVWDFTSPDTLAPSYLARTSVVAGAAAARAEQLKRNKYSNLANSADIQFVPIAIESLGPWGVEATDLITQIGSRLARHTGDPRALPFLKQRIGLAVQRGNAASVSGTSPLSDNLE